MTTVMNIVTWPWRAGVALVTMLYTMLDNAVYNAPRLRLSFGRGYWVPTLISLAVAAFSVYALTGNVSNLDTSATWMFWSTLVLSLGVLLPVRSSGQAVDDSTWFFLNLFRTRPQVGTTTTTKTTTVRAGAGKPSPKTVTKTMPKNVTPKSTTTPKAKGTSSSTKAKRATTAKKKS